jgi:hypothetical protein
LTGNYGVPLSHIKTPPHYSFSKTPLRDRDPISFSLKTLDISAENSYGNLHGLKSFKSTLNKSAYITPGVGDYLKE